MCEINCAIKRQEVVKGGQNTEHVWLSKTSSRLSIDFKCQTSIVRGLPSTKMAGAICLMQSCMDIWHLPNLWVFLPLFSHLQRLYCTLQQHPPEPSYCLLTSFSFPVLLTLLFTNPSSPAPSTLLLPASHGLCGKLTFCTHFFSVEVSHFIPSYFTHRKLLISVPHI